jgi:hypothetical protein
MRGKQPFNKQLILRKVELSALDNSNSVQIEIHIDSDVGA